MARTNTQQDWEWLLAATRGDHRSWGSLYDRYAPLMMALGTRLLGQASEAEDVLHAVWLEAWEHAGSYDPCRGTVRAWLLVRMRSRCQDRIKSAIRARSTPFDEVTTGEARDVIEIARAEQFTEAAKTRELVESLPEPLRNVLILAYFGGLSASEIASELEVPHGTVKSRIASGLAQLRRLMFEAAQGAMLDAGPSHRNPRGEA